MKKFFSDHFANIKVKKAVGGRKAKSASDAKANEDLKQGPSIGTSGFHWLPVSDETPFSMCGWATFDGRWGGVAFRINRDYFHGRDPELYYMDDDYFGELPFHAKDHLEEMRDKIERYSSGLTDIRICEQVEQNDFEFRGHIHHPTKVTMIRFRPDNAKIKDSVEICEKQTPTSQLGEYIFVLPKAGEFYIELGEIIDGKRIALHIDDFCMK